MADFQTSTHRQHWILSRQDLAQKYQIANQRAIQMLLKYGATRVEVQQDGSLVYPGTPLETERNGTERHTSLPEPLTIDEEFLIRRYYELKIQQVCAAFAFPNKIQATAVLFFKRFYLQWSVMEHDPKHIMLTCIYLSCKVEEFHVSAEELGKGIQQDPQVVLKNELTVLQGLHFDLIVYAPYRSLDGFLFDMENFVQGTNNSSTQKLQELKEAAKFVVDTVILTDCPLLFTPGQLALAALRKANLEERAVDFERYLQSLCDRHPKHTFKELTLTFDAIDTTVDVSRQPKEADLMPIDRKLKYCRNPGLQDESKKRERKVKHKSKRVSQDTSMTTTVDASPMV
ncbi:hypothetical protein O6H91_15G047200 [Diphasiastrum complanatum]|uniref:Uncharacterized protein n=1 Tax=Diphasiastrum complanatum TaxID=34168 RepID=A0ACC2BI11_DIPCM|nr:hypothetical protein O6H91_15G047200 [Diphasiastrum complanatum]